MKKDRVISLKVPQATADQIDAVAAKRGQGKADFLRSIINRTVFGHLYSFETKMKDDLDNAISADANPTDILIIADMIRDLLYQIAKERR